MVNCTSNLRPAYHEQGYLEIKLIGLFMEKKSRRNTGRYGWPDYFNHLPSSYLYQ